MNLSDPISRRGAFAKLGLIFNGVVGAVLAVPVVRYLLSPASRRPAGADAWISLGAVLQFPIGETRLASFRNSVVGPSDGPTANIPCWVRRISAEKFQVFAINCAHLGCPVRWFPQSGLFMCPCHGGAYYADGSRASGPPERGLFEYPCRIERQELWVQAEEMPTPGAPGVVASAAGTRKPPCV
jgi:menaquinol-cytochrome c reductase iron-sulfur subunit